MNKFKTVFIVLLAVIVISVLGYAAFAGADDEPGGSSDPLVTQSYVDQYMQWKIVDLKTGQILQGHAGTELITRRGQAVVVDATGNGIPDVTGGADIHAGSAAPLNHLLVVPRDDGRGVKAQSPAVVMYRGGATVR
ncbi:hypothetical protein L9W92_00080 [Pelotomaculum terephthalicicum JT]|uniref:hypothetical protein n=1 Tax=Pelotomaculum TaxID=191373 RepID=UPI0009D40D23|nr:MULTISPECIES: hypothetical protein [Pelotomaculum]MCG9966454.1 hypothetical protein [Pelotomaculum terephthalicicum JT]OPX89189.1 MAG: hypothetical protein A4E54_01067 [Pelotomaculum sp. PtaB.Bin117]OPY63405.1 MAG: hypothetical protein A4E56_00627 [Pelotomaculum sp. PtaU1.Bin065]